MPDSAVTSPDRQPPADGARANPEPASRTTFGRAVRRCFAKYATFSGRASRPEYWWFALFLFLGHSAAGIVDAAAFDPGTALFAPLFGLVTLLPVLAAGWRRMHDSGRSGLHLVYPFIVMVGIASFGGLAMGFPEGRVQDASMIVLAFAGLVFLISPLLVLWWLTRPSDPNPNPYGPPPAEVT